MAKRFVKLNEALGYCFNVEDAYECIAKFQTKSNHDFTIAKADKGFGNIDVLAKKRELLWSNDGCSQVDDEIIPFDGLPFFFLGKKVYECKDGKRKAHKRKIHGKTLNSLSSNQCPATLTVFEILKFPQYKINSLEKSMREEMETKLFADLSIGKALAERRFYIFFPALNEHRNHFVLKDGNLVRPESLDITESEDSLNFFDITKDLTESSFQTCCNLLEKLKELTYTCDDITLAYGHIMLKDTLDRLHFIKQNGLFNSAPSES